MKTLKELNEKAWYRLIKVLYVFLYLPLLPVLFGAYQAGKEYHQPVYPKTIEVALNDPEFYRVSDYYKIAALSAIDLNFNNLNYSEQTQFIENINKIDIRTKKFEKTQIILDKATDLSKTSSGPWEDYQKEDQSAKNKKQMTEKESKGAEQKTKIDEQPVEYASPDVIGYGYKDTVFFVVERKTPLPPNGMEGKYHYTSYHTRDIGKTILYLFIAILCYVLFMEIIRRTFYYVVVGKLFPKE